MQPIDFDQLIGEIKAVLAHDPRSRFGVIGRTPITYDLVAFFRAIGAENRLTGVYSDVGDEQAKDTLNRPMWQLRADAPETVIIASDSEKEQLLELASPSLVPSTRVILAGHGHFAFRDQAFYETVQTALVPSLANGYPNTLVHLYQCLQNAARLKLSGVVAEFGMFKGGTTMLLSRFIERLGQSWPVIGFDTFAGFPPKRSVLDMYSHPDCVFSNEDLVRRHVSGRNIEIVAGDVITTASRLVDANIILAFMDTDNFTSASAVLDVIQDRIVVSGAIVFDHFTGRDRFRYTLGERIAAKRLLADPRYFNLHETGVFIRQR